MKGEGMREVQGGVEGNGVGEGKKGGGRGVRGKGAGWEVSRVRETFSENNSLGERGVG